MQIADDVVFSPRCGLRPGPFEAVHKLVCNGLITINISWFKRRLEVYRQFVLIVSF